jgi:hypothetical protein
MESDIVTEEQHSGTTLIVPPTGLFKGSKGLFPMSLIWLVMSRGIFGGTKYGLLSQRKRDELEWLADELRRATGLSAQPSPG